MNIFKRKREEIELKPSLVDINTLSYLDLSKYITSILKNETCNSGDIRIIRSNSIGEVFVDYLPDVKKIFPNGILEIGGDKFSLDYCNVHLKMYHDNLVSNEIKCCIKKITVCINGQVTVYCDVPYLEYIDYSRVPLRQHDIFRTFKVRKYYDEYFNSITSYLKLHISEDISNKKSEHDTRIKIMEKRRIAYEEFNKAIFKEVILEYFASVIDYCDLYEIKNENNSFEILLKSKNVVINMKEYLAINEKNSNLLFELSDAIYRFNQKFSYICNILIKTSDITSIIISPK